MTKDALVFFHYLPKRDFVVPLERICEVSFVRSHLGKATPYRLLKVQFEGESGPDSLAFFVNDPDGVASLQAASKMAEARKVMWMKIFHFKCSGFSLATSTNPFNK